VAKSRGLLGTRQVGHAGTLDPDATGVLLLGVGRATKLLRYLSPLGKAYVGEVVFGVETSTLDAAGEVTATHEMAGLTLARVADAARAFEGAIEQIPPMVSAVKIDGRRLHELARQGIEVERPPRPVTIHSLAVRPGPEGEPHVFTLASTAPRAPTSAPWQQTWATPWAAAPTCATSGARRWAPTRWTTRCRWSRCRPTWSGRWSRWCATCLR
jgi:tRNA pseudouridine55 synthase